MDDAHAGSNVLRESFTIRVKREDEADGEELYATLTAMFRQDFKELGQLGTFDVVSGGDWSVLEWEGGL